MLSDYNYNPIYGIFNQVYAEKQMREQQHYDQVMKSAECVNKFRDFLESIDKVEPENQEMTAKACCCAFWDYMKRHGMC